MIIGGHRGSIKRLLLLVGLSFASCAVPALPEDYLKPMEETLNHENPCCSELLAINQNRSPAWLKNHVIPSPDT